MPTMILNRHTGEWMEKSEYYRWKYSDAYKVRGDVPAPRIASDNTEIQSMADGKIYTSKADYRRSLKAQGLIEVGNDAPRMAPQWDAPKADATPNVEKAMHQAWKQLGGD